MLDATSKTAQGISMTMRLFDNDTNDKRTRLPRVFYN